MTEQRAWIDLIATIRSMVSSLCADFALLDACLVALVDRSYVPEMVSRLRAKLESGHLILGNTLTNVEQLACKLAQVDDSEPPPVTEPSADVAERLVDRCTFARRPPEIR